MDEKLELSQEAIRVLGVLIEKEKTTPDQYPLTLNSIVNGCNQTTNRSPIVSYDELAVERALGELRDKNLALRGIYAGSRVPKHRHNVEEVLKISPAAISVLCVLLLRGAQTLGEIKQRSERLFKFDDLEECDKAIDELTQNKSGLAKRLEREPGQKEARINHDLTIEDDSDFNPPKLRLIENDEIEEEFFENKSLEGKVARLEKEVTVLTQEIMKLRSEIDTLRN